MERWKEMLIVAIMTMIMATGCMSTSTLAKKSTLTEVNPVAVPTIMTPVATKYIIGTPVGTKVVETINTEDLKIMQVKENEVSFNVPVLNKTGDYEIYASWAWTDGDKWVLFAQDDYLIDSTKNLGVRSARLTLPKLGIGWYWVRIWGQDKESKDWLWINQSSPYCRNDVEGNPGYEMLVHPASGQHQAVSAAYQTRK